MNSLEFSVSLCHYLDMRLPVHAPKYCLCGKAVDEKCEHLMKCTVLGGVSKRHELLKANIAELMLQAGFDRELEVGHLFSDNERMDIIMLPDDLAAVPVAADVTVRSTSTYNIKASNTAINVGVRVKNKKYKEQCDALSMRFLPIVFDDLGGMNAEAKTFIDMLIAAIPNDPDHFTPPNSAAYTPYQMWLQILSVSLYRGSARAAILLGSLAQEGGQAATKLRDWGGLTPLKK